jgi:DNA repair photolyase
MYERYHGKDTFCKVPEPRKDIVEATQKQLASGKYEGKTIQLCFMCDPYPADIDTTPTRGIIKAIKAAGAHVQILTKGGIRAERDFDLLDSGDSFGVTISGYRETSNINEPRADNTTNRLRTLRDAHSLGIKTWLSCEPVFDVDQIYDLIIYTEFIDFYKIGKLNYYPSDINWGEFGRECERLCKEYGCNYYIKEDLRKEMDKISHEP